MKNAVLLMDYQNRYVSIESPSYIKGAEALERKISLFLKDVQEYAYVVATHDYLKDDWSETDSQRLYINEGLVHMLLKKYANVRYQDMKNTSCFANQSVKDFFKTFDNLFVLGVAHDEGFKRSINDLNFFNNVPRIYVVKDLVISQNKANSVALFDSLEGQDIKIVTADEALDIMKYNTKV